MKPSWLFFTLRLFSLIQITVCLKFLIFLTGLLICTGFLFFLTDRYLIHECLQFFLSLKFPLIDVHKPLLISFMIWLVFKLSLGSLLRYLIIVIKIKCIALIQGMILKFHQNWHLTNVRICSVSFLRQNIRNFVIFVHIKEFIFNTFWAFIQISRSSHQISDSTLKIILILLCCWEITLKLR